MNKEHLRAVLFVLVFFLAVNCLASGQAADSPLANVPAPNPPFIARAPQQSSWVIVITPTGNGPGASSQKSLRAQLWTKSGTAMQCSNEWSDGTRTEDTVVGHTKFAQSPDGKGVHEYDPTLDPRYHDFGAGDFEMLDWIAPEHYAGAVNHGGERCYLFRTNGTPPVGGPSEPHNLTLAQINAPRSPTTVYVSMNTGLPLEIENATAKYVFQFGSPGELRMPEVQPPAPPPPPAPAAPPPVKPKPKKTPATTPKPVKKSAPDETSDL